MEKDKKFVLKVRAVILHEGRLLVVRHSAHAEYFALPGGKLEWGEDIKQCLAREIVEELGVKPEIGRLLYVNNFLDKEVHCVEFFFEVKNGLEYLDIAGKERSHSFEIHEMLFVGPTDDIKMRPRDFLEDFKMGRIISDEVRYIKE